jgi:hypothetical protein
VIQTTYSLDSYDLVSFSQKERKYEVENTGFDKFSRWRQDEEPIMWDWDNCHIGIAKQLDDERKISGLLGAKLAETVSIWKEACTAEVYDAVEVGYKAMEQMGI